MIDNSVLMKGNLVQDIFGTIYEVNIIGHHDNPDYTHAKSINGSGQNGFEGIAITEDNILKFDGFRKGAFGIFFHSVERVGLKRITDTHWRIIWDSDGIGDSIQYLHEFQNAYKILTKQELIIKLL